MEATLNPPTSTSRLTAETPHLRAAWQNAESWCIKCGFCLPACPTYRETGVEASSPRGRLDLMYAVAAGRLPLQAAEHQMWFCLGCQACETACPSGIRYHDILESARLDSVASRAGSPGAWRRRFLLRVLLPSSLLLWMLTALLAVYQASGLQRMLRGTRLLRIVPPLARLEARMPPVAFPVRWRGALRDALSPAVAGAPRQALLLTGCVMDAAFGSVHAATVRVLARNGIRTEVPAGQGCCGALHLHAGDEHGARKLARSNIAAFEAAGVSPIVINSAGCGALLKQYARLLAGDPAWQQRALRFSARVQDISEFLAGLPLAPPGRLPLRVAYDDPCHLLHAQQVGEQPRQVLGRIPGLTLVPLREADMCCGSAGSYSVTQPEMSTRLLNRKLDHIVASGAEVVATGNPGCLLQLRMGVRARRLPVRVVHPVELLAEAYGRS